MSRYDMIWLTFRISCSNIRVPSSQTRHLGDIKRVRDCPDRSASFWIFSYLRETILRPWADSRAPATLRRSALGTAHDTMIDSSKQRITTQRMRRKRESSLSPRNGSRTLSSCIKPWCRMNSEGYRCRWWNYAWDERRTMTQSRKSSNFLESNRSSNASTLGCEVRSRVIHSEIQFE